MHMLMFGIYWVLMFLISVLVHKYGGSNSTITKDALGIYFIFAPLVPIAGIWAGLVTGLMFICDKVGVDLFHVLVERSSPIRRFMFGLSDLLAWIPKFCGLRVVSTDEFEKEEQVKRMKNDESGYEWRKRGKGEWIKEAEGILLARAIHEYQQMGTIQHNASSLADDECSEDDEVHTIH
ncbi:MAG: hypothetical protein HY225_03245 [Candidatus Vogelbacteria bacterium]|nr:hypothetical protein [Candidatus Vogelbacteria bacterium]